MTEAGRFDRQSAERITRAVKGFEGMSAVLPPTKNTPQGQQWVRVRLNDTLSAFEPVEGTVTLPKADGSGWLSIDRKIPNIYHGLNSPDAVLAGTNVWVVPLAGKWFAIQIAFDEGGNASRGCCGKCVDRVWLTVFGNFADTYVVLGMPAELSPNGGLALQYVGLTSSLSPWTDGNPYWESATFEVTCAAGTDTYFWRMVIGAGTPCYAGGGPDNVYLYLVLDGSASACAFDEHKCQDGGSPADPARQFVNIESFRGRCGSTLYLRWPHTLQNELEELLPCKVCVYPYSASGFIPPNGSGQCCGPEASTCIETYATTNGRTPNTWPRVLTLKANSSTVNGIEDGDTFPLVWDGTQWSGSRPFAFDTCEVFEKSVSASVRCGSGTLTLSIASPTNFPGTNGYNWPHAGGGHFIDHELAASATIDETLPSNGFWCMPVSGPDVDLGDVTWRIYE